VEVYETSLHQDLNGDTIIGPTVTAIETTGATTLAKVADSYFFNYASNGPQLMKDGAYVTPGQFPGWTPIGVEQGGAGYWLAWKNGPDQYIVWETDGAGNFIRNMINPSSGTTTAVQQFEPFLHQDLNGDGVIPIEAFGATKLVQSGNNFVLDPMAALGGPLVKFNGANAVVGQFGAWTPIAAEQTASGYGIAWKNGAADQYLVWSTDSSGNWLSQTSVMSGSDPAFEAFESAFQQDLNLNGMIDVPMMMASEGSAAEVGSVSSGTLNFALLTSHMASEFATPAGEGTGVVADPQSSLQPFLAKPVAWSSLPR
jgi:hypothetical protein